VKPISVPPRSLARTLLFTFFAFAPTRFLEAIPAFDLILFLAPILGLATARLFTPAPLAAPPGFFACTDFFIDPLLNGQ
jgi:hypothetical protein